MRDESEITNFLNEFKTKAKIFGILFADDRGKNQQSLADLGITAVQRQEVLMELTICDYCEGAMKNDQYGNAPMWVFGKTLKSKEIYIKITCFPEKAFCISFHIAEYPLKYPLKN
jgi:hypothetical protein